MLIYRCFTLKGALSFLLHLSLCLAPSLSLCLSIPLPLSPTPPPPRHDAGVHGPPGGPGAVQGGPGGLLLWFQGHRGGAQARGGQRLPGEEAEEEAPAEPRQNHSGVYGPLVVRG